MADFRLHLLDGATPNAEQLRTLAAWYWNLAEKAGNPAIWESGKAGWQLRKTLSGKPCNLNH